MAELPRARHSANQAGIGVVVELGAFEFSAGRRMAIRLDVGLGVFSGWLEEKTLGTPLRRRVLGGGLDGGDFHAVLLTLDGKVSHGDGQHFALVFLRQYPEESRSFAFRVDGVRH